MPHGQTVIAKTQAQSLFPAASLLTCLVEHSFQNEGKAIVNLHSPSHVLEARESN